MDSFYMKCNIELKQINLKEMALFLLKQAHYSKSNYPKKTLRRVKESLRPC